MLVIRVRVCNSIMLALWMMSGVGFAKGSSCSPFVPFQEAHVHCFSYNAWICST